MTVNALIRMAEVAKASVDGVVEDLEELGSEWESSGKTVDDAKEYVTGLKDVWKGKVSELLENLLLKEERVVNLFDRVIEVLAGLSV